VRGLRSLALALFVSTKHFLCQARGPIPSRLSGWWRCPRTPLPPSLLSSTPWPTEIFLSSRRPVDEPTRACRPPTPAAAVRHRARRFEFAVWLARLSTTVGSPNRCETPELLPPHIVDGVVEPLGFFLLSFRLPSLHLFPFLFLLTPDYLSL
jgi:hypothetical protein